MTTKATLTISFGTSLAGMRAAAIDPTEAAVAAAFPEADAFTAWTSGRIMEKVRAERGEVHHTIDEALAAVAAGGYDELIVVPTCLMKAFEYDKIARTLAAWETPCASVKLARPLLAQPEDRRALAAVLADEYGSVPEAEMVVFMGHGSKGGGNEIYHQMNSEFAALGLPHFLVATIEGEPPFSEALSRVDERKPALVHLVPLMIVAGEHATVDMAGDAPESWASQLSARGYAAKPYIRGLGEMPTVQAMVVDHARSAAPFTGGAA